MFNLDDEEDEDFSIRPETRFAEIRVLSQI